MRLTMRELGRYAGVSSATVSRALRHDPRVAPETIQRVMRASTELGYITNGVARSLRLQATMAVGVITDDISNPVQACFTQAASEELERAGYFTIIGQRREGRRDDASLFNKMLERGIDGLLWSPEADEGDALAALLARSPVPIVLLDRKAKDHCTDCVLSWQYDDIVVAVRQLMAAGHERIAMLPGPQCAWPGRERRRAYVNALHYGGLAVDRLLLRECPQSIEQGYHCVAELVEHEPRATALVVCGTRLGVGALHALRDRKVRIPEQLSVVLVAPPELYDLCDPTFDAVTLPVRELGQEAAQLLVARITKAETGPAKTIRVPCSRSQGGSIGPPSPGAHKTPRESLGVTSGERSGECGGPLK